MHLSLPVSIKTLTVSSTSASLVFRLSQYCPECGIHKQRETQETDTNWDLSKNFHAKKPVCFPAWRNGIFLCLSLREFLCPAGQKKPGRWKAMPRRLFSLNGGFFFLLHPPFQHTHTHKHTHSVWHTHILEQGKEFPAGWQDTGQDLRWYQQLVHPCPHPAEPSALPSAQSWVTSPTHRPCSVPQHSITLAAASTNPLAPSQPTGFLSPLSLPKQIDLWHLPLCFHPLKGGKLKAWLLCVRFHASFVLSHLDVK